MDTYYDVENTNTGGMIVNVTEKKGDDTKTFVKKFTRFTEGFDYINKSRFHEAFDALNNLGWLYAHRGKDISIQEIYLSAYKELDKIIDCLQNNEQYIFVHPKHQSSSRPNLNNKIANWLVEHQSVLDDLSSYCDIETEELISSLNTKQSPNIIFNNGTPFKVIMRDEETNVALLKNDKSGFYNVACDINKENNSWAYSLVYTEDYDTAKSFYANKTAEKMDYDRYRTMEYLTENYPTVDFENIKGIVEHAKEIYQYDVEDEVGERITLEDLSEFITKMYIENDYQNNNITFIQSPISDMGNLELLDQFFNNDLEIEDIQQDDELEI